MLTRCFEIARECLAADPMRKVPALEDEIDGLSFQYEGRVRTQADIDCAHSAGFLPAFLVANNALGLADELVDEEEANG
jgi:hypothetical protein